MTSTIPTDAATHVVCAYRWLDAGKVDLAEEYLRRLAPQEMRGASTTLQRLAVIVEALMYEAELATVAAALLTPDALPVGFGMTGRAMPPCPWCGVVDCDQRDVHGQLVRASETTWRREANGLPA